MLVLQVEVVHSPVTGLVAFPLPVDTVPMSTSSSGFRNAFVQSAQCPAVVLQCSSTSPDKFDSSTRQLPCSSTMSQRAFPGSTTTMSPGMSCLDDAALHSKPGC